MAISQHNPTFPTITQSFLHKVRTFPDKPTFHKKTGTQWKSYTWKEFYSLVQSTAYGLMELGLKPGESACILSNTCFEWALADMAILGCKAITVPIYASNTPEDCTYIASHCNASYIFVEDVKQLEKTLSIAKNLPNLKKIIVMNAAGHSASDGMVLTLDDVLEKGEKAKANAKEDLVAQNMLSVAPNDLFTICYTSGTTGLPKGVMLRHDSLASVIEDIEETMGGKWTQDDVVLSFLPMSHIFGKVEAMAVYHFGWNVYYAESIDKLFVNIGEVRPTVLFAVPRIFEKAFIKIKSTIDESSPLKKTLFELAQMFGRNYYTSVWTGKSAGLFDRVKYEIAKAVVFKKIYAKFGGRLRYCIAGGAPLPRDIGEFMQIIGIPILEGYGLTETCAAVTLNPATKPQFGSIGKPLKEVQLKIADDGEILLKSRKVMVGYFKNEESTKEVLESDGWFHTGDIGTIDSEGYVRITDRKKDIIVTSAGKNVAPQKIENIAKSHKYISQIMVYGDKRNYLTALVVLDREETIKFSKEHNILFSEYSELVKNQKVLNLVQSIFDDINSRLASYETIKKFRILANEFTVESGELTPSLKIKRRYCSDKFKRELDELYDSATGQPAMRA